MGRRFLKGGVWNGEFPVEHLDGVWNETQVVDSSKIDKASILL